MLSNIIPDIMHVIFGEIMTMLQHDAGGAGRETTVSFGVALWNHWNYCLSRKELHVSQDELV